MQHTINQNVQSNLNKLERDCRLVYTAIDKMLAEDARARSTINGRVTRRGLITFVLSLLGPLTLLAFRPPLGARGACTVPPGIQSACSCVWSTGSADSISREHG